MSRFLRRRLLGLVLMLWVAVTCAFLAFRLLPGGPFSDQRRLAAGIVEALDARYHLDWPIWRQYLQYVGPINLDRHGIFGDRQRVFGGLLAGDLGPSLWHVDQTVSQILAESVPLSLALASLAFAWAALAGAALGVAAAAARGGRLDLVLRSGVALAGALPSFVLAGLLVSVFALTLAWSPSAGSAGVAHYVLPAAALGAPLTACFARLVRDGLVDTLARDHVRTAIASGLAPATVVRRHVLRAALLPALAHVGPAATGILTGGLVVERIFAIPGAGSHFVASASHGDYTLLVGVALVYAVLIYALHALVDAASTRLDPRVTWEAL